jgi:hypothetical protein
MRGKPAIDLREEPSRQAVLQPNGRHGLDEEANGSLSLKLGEARSISIFRQVWRNRCKVKLTRSWYNSMLMMS